MCHGPQSLDVSSFQDPPHSLFLFSHPFTTCESLTFLEDLGHIFLYFMFIPVSCPPPFPACSLTPISLRPFLYRDSFGVFFWSYLSTRKQSTLHIIEVGMGGKPIGFMFCVPELFSPISHHLSLVV